MLIVSRLRKSGCYDLMFKNYFENVLCKNFLYKCSGIEQLYVIFEITKSDYTIIKYFISSKNKISTVIMCLYYEIKIISYVYFSN